MIATIQSATIAGQQIALLHLPHGYGYQIPGHPARPHGQLAYTSPQAARKAAAAEMSGKFWRSSDNARSGRV